MKIIQISYKLGIDDSYYFSRLFTKTIGISPKKYREKGLQKRLKNIDFLTIACNSPKNNQE